MEFDYKPQYTLTNEMLDLVVEITKHLTKLDHLSNLLKQPQLRRINRLKTIHSSCAIEGNTLTLEQVTAVINGKIVLAPQNEILEVKQAFEAYTFLEEINPLDIKDMLRVHGVMMKNLCDEAGKLRSKNVGVYNGTVAVHIAPPLANVQPLLQILYDWIKTEKVNELIKYSIFHYEFEFIHPFNDGNGRMGRFMQSAFLSKWNSLFAYLPVESIIKERQQEYYKAFRDCQADSGKSNYFIVFMLNAILDSVKHIHGESGDLIKSQTTQIEKLMGIILHTPLSAKEIAARLNIKSMASLKKNYLDPAIKLGLITMTDPNTPTSNKQKYYKL
jgi:Fic family protein